MPVHVSDVFSEKRLIPNCKEVITAPTSTTVNTIHNAETSTRLKIKPAKYSPFLEMKLYLII